MKQSLTETLKYVPEQDEPFPEPKLRVNAWVLDSARRTLVAMASMVVEFEIGVANGSDLSAGEILVATVGKRQR